MKLKVFKKSKTRSKEECELLAAMNSVEWEGRTCVLYSLLISTLQESLTRRTPAAIRDDYSEFFYLLRSPLSEYLST